MPFFTVDIYTPSKVVAKGIQANSLKVPTTKGEINILPDHTHMVVRIDTGILSVETSSGPQYFSMTTGVCKILGDTVTIFAQCSEKSSEIDLERAKNAAKNAQKKLTSGESIGVDELVKYSRKLDRAEIRIKLAAYR